jgi:zinc transport system permease protein
MIEALQYDFMRNAVLAGLLASVACGIVGSYVVVNRVALISGGIAHAAYGGIGLGYFFGFNPVLGAAVFSVGSALGLGVIQRKTRQRTDTLIAVMWAIGMAFGILLVDLAAGYKADLLSYLFGSILAVPTADLVIMAVLDVAIVALVFLFYKELLSISFDETYAEVSGVKVDAIYLMLLCLVAITVVMLMRVVGLIMVIALLTIPAAIASLFAKSLKGTMLLASTLAAVFILVGLALSFALDLTSGAAIILVAGVAYLVSLLFRPHGRRGSGVLRTHHRE